MKKKFDYKFALFVAPLLAMTFLVIAIFAFTDTNGLPMTQALKIISLVGLGITIGVFIYSLVLLIKNKY